MTRPEMVRADSIDLQDHDAPSAQNHPARPSPLQTKQSAATNNFAPHQAETLREVAAETAVEEARSPRVSWANGAEAGDLQQYAEDLAAGVTSSLASRASNGSSDDMAARGQQDDLGITRNGATGSQDNADDGDMDIDDGDLSDDMIDKISSSPSIEDARGLPTRRHHLPGVFPEDVQEPWGNNVEARRIEWWDDCRVSPTGRSQDFCGDVSEFDEIMEPPAIDVCHPTHPTRRELPVQVKPQAGTPRISSCIEDEGVDIDGLMIPYEGSSSGDDDDDDNFFLQSIDATFIESGWGDECLHDAEDIDFELVYALHTFTATVEGQANATKGDAMVLLDDSNSYWWLVRVVKDSSIGYLPAEHIETPTERLARLNKHRNIDLSAAMLGDQADKGKSTLKTAMRRKKKNVSFAAPTYVDYSDYDYDTEDEEEENEIMAAQQQQQQQQAQQAQQAQQQASTNGDDDDNGDDTAKVAPLRPRTQQKPAQAADSLASNLNETLATSNSKPISRTSEEIFETNGVEGPKKKADGTVRDSFFKDDTVETKKITLTPGLLRDDGATRASSESVERGMKQRPSFDKLLEKDSKEDKKKAKDKKEKEKKGGFRSLFSRKDKKKGDEDDESFGKRSMDVGHDSAERPSEDIGDEFGADRANMSPQRNPSKLTKQQPRVESALSRKNGSAPRDASDGMDLSAFLNESSLKSVATVPPASMRIVDPDADLFEDDDDDDEEDETHPQAHTNGRSASVDDGKQAAPRQMPARSQSADSQMPAQTTIAKSRMQIDDTDSDEADQEEEETPAPATGINGQTKLELSSKPIQELEPGQAEKQFQQQQSLRPSLPGAFPDSYVSIVSEESTSTVTADRTGTSEKPRERLSESPVEVSPITPTETQPPPLTGDSSSQEHSSPVSSPSPELIDRDEAGGVHRKQDSVTTSTSTTTVSAWNDESLRAFFDSGAEIRDLLVVVYDKNDVEPVGSDHPVAGALFKEQNAKLAEITTQLDNMLGDWLARKQRLRGTV
ncbi:hypothetical protein BD289DRAFT_487034 [Coniella lustricola]|uniref:SH3 domain-containing protein n=1 Tax=Coniella lustricola TaxID=2025994 RepID=A0A2T2ZT46_9PEZI|nr:hypothetical protein BD289DRAFT_487034 [Coniella lustricola]